MEKEPILIVERIVNKRRLKNTTLEYLCKWLNKSDEHNSWISFKKLGCKDLVKQFEDELINTYHPVKNFKSKDFRPLRITGFFIQKMVFVMEFLGKDKAWTVTSEQAKINCPDLVVQFYEKHLDIHNCFLQKKEMAVNAEDEEFVVEDIVNERQISRKYEYLVKWKSKSYKHNSWVKAKDLNPKLIEKFRKELRDHYHPIINFENNLRPLRIVNVRFNRDTCKLYYEVEFLGTLETQIVDAAIAKKRCIDLVIDFYEHVMFFEWEETNSQTENADS